MRPFNIDSPSYRTNHDPYFYNIMDHRPSKEFHKKRYRKKIILLMIYVTHYFQEVLYKVGCLVLATSCPIGIQKMKLLISFFCMMLFPSTLAMKLLAMTYVPLEHHNCTAAYQNDDNHDHRKSLNVRQSNPSYLHTNYPNSFYLCIIYVPHEVF